MISLAQMFSVRLSLLHVNAASSSTWMMCQLTDLKPAEGQNLAKAFVEELKPYDGGMAEKLKAAGEGVLRYVGTIDVKAGTGKVELKAFPKDHAFAGTKHADNVVLFHTKRYTPQPLVLVGPGAGIPVNADDSWEFALPEYKQ